MLRNLFILIVLILMGLGMSACNTSRYAAAGFGKDVEQWGREMTRFGQELQAQVPSE